MKLFLVLSLVLLYAGGVSGEYLKDMSVSKVVDGDTDISLRYSPETPPA
jgi:hypothetical protein